MWRRKRTSKPDESRPREAVHAEGLPSRKVRHSKRKMSFAAMLGPGIAVFGAIFFGLVGLELYQAKHSSAPAANVQPQPLATTETHPVQSGQKATEASSKQSNTGAAAPSPAQSKSNAQKTEANPMVKPAVVSVQHQPVVTPARPKAKRHVVKKGDTLFKLSRLYYGNHSGVARIASYNGLRPDQQLIAGTVIKIPVKQ
jgi:nucleoid-associated protein YgaU